MIGFGPNNCLYAASPFKHKYSQYVEKELTEEEKIKKQKMENILSAKIRALGNLAIAGVAELFLDKIKNEIEKLEEALKIYYILD